MIPVVHVIDTDDKPVLIPYDNIAYIAEQGETTYIYLRQVAGTNRLWYVLTHERVDILMRRLIEMKL